MSEKADDNLNIIVEKIRAFSLSRPVNRVDVSLDDETYNANSLYDLSALSREWLVRGFCTGRV